MQYLITANVNVAPRMAGIVEGYQPAHPVATVDYYDVEADSWTAAAEAMFAIGNRVACDLHGKEWPSDVRSLSVGDVLYVSRNSDSAVQIVACASVGWVEIDLPADRLQVDLRGTEATSRPAPLKYGRRTYHGPTCEQSYAFGTCFHDSCYEVAASYDRDREQYVQYYPAADD